MTEKVKLTLALPVSGEMLERIRNVNPRLEVTSLSRAQRLAWRGSTHSVSNDRPTTLSARIGFTPSKIGSTLASTT